MIISNGAEVNKSSVVKTMWVEENQYPFHKRQFLIYDYRVTSRYLCLNLEDGTLRCIPLAEINDFRLSNSEI